MLVNNQQFLQETPCDETINGFHIAVKRGKNGSKQFCKTLEGRDTNYWEVVQEIQYHVHLSWREAETRTYEAKQISIEASAAFIPSSLFSHSNTLSLTDGLTGHAIAKLGFVLFLETYVHEVRCIQFHLVAADSSSMRCNSLFAGLGLARGSFSPSKYSDWRTESSELEGKPKPRQSLKTFYLLHSFISNFDIFFQQQTS